MLGAPASSGGEYQRDAAQARFGALAQSQMANLFLLQTVFGVIWATAAKSSEASWQTERAPSAPLPATPNPVCVRSSAAKR